MENILSLKDVKKGFAGKNILDGLNLSVRKGEKVVIMGKSGEGKSVTLKCIAGLLTQDEGSVNVLGKEVGLLDEEALKNLRCRMGYLFQGAALYDSMTVRDNLEFPLKRVLNIHRKSELNDRSEAVLKDVGLLEVIDKMPAELSGGMRKRLALARTLIVEPEVMLYDEPTTGLDSITSREISELIVKTQEQNKATSLIITHDLLCAAITADRVLIMNEGKYIADGTYGEIEHSGDPFIQSFFN
ncbi:MAG: ATP-binding cassette domain-containing protein [Chitinophagaceae bacterium]